MNDEAGGARPAAAADDNLTLWENTEWVMALLTALPPRQREVMAFIVGGFSPTEIAQMLGRTPTAVRNNLRAARGPATPDVLGPAAPGLSQF